VKKSLNLALTLILGVLLPTSVYAQPQETTITPLFTFACDSTGTICPDGEQPNSLIQSADGNFYGTTLTGGTGNKAAGTVFKNHPGRSIFHHLYVSPRPERELP